MLQKLTINVGDPIDFTELINRMKSENRTEVKQRDLAMQNKLHAQVSVHIPTVCSTPQAHWRLFTLYFNFQLEIRKAITDVIQEALANLRIETEQLHFAKHS